MSQGKGVSLSPSYGVPYTADWWEKEHKVEVNPVCSGLAPAACKPDRHDGHVSVTSRTIGSEGLA